MRAHWLGIYTLTDTFTSHYTQVVKDICHSPLLLVTLLAGQITGQSGPGCWVWGWVPPSHAFAGQHSSCGCSHPQCARHSCLATSELQWLFTWPHGKRSLHPMCWAAHCPILSSLWNPFYKLEEPNVGACRFLPWYSTPWHTPAHSVVTSSPSLINSFRQMWAMIPAASASPRTLIIVLNLSLENQTVMVSCWLFG